MSDVLDRLKAALADRCSTDRHVIISGRARVFLWDSVISTRLFLLIIGLLLLPLGCGDDTSGPDYATLVISTTSLPNATVTVPYSETLVATGGDSTYTWSVTVSSLPAGLSLTAATGLISGTPTFPLGSQAFTVQVASGDGQTDTRQLTITVEPPVLQPSELCSDYPVYATATFEDGNLEAVIRAALFAGDQERLTCGQVSWLTILRAYYAEITSLVGIQNLTSLGILYLEGNSISDIGPLSGLTNLTYLHLGHNSISDISALTGLMTLEDLFLSNNSISDISSLSGLTSLEYLGLSSNSISDISALSGLTSLMYLSLGSNSISDISALSGLTSLTYLWLYNNTNLTDIQPLLDNTGLGAGDTVYLQSTSVSCTDVAALAAKGVTVLSDCP